MSTIFAVTVYDDVTEETYNVKAFVSAEAASSFATRKGNLDGNEYNVEELDLDESPE